MEDNEKFDIFLNNREVEHITDNYYLDHDMINLKLDRTYFTAGRNELRLVCTNYDYRTNLEAIFIRGKFGVNTASHITELPEKLFFGDWCEQALANYSGNVTYFAEIDVPDNAILKFADWRGTLLGVKIDDDAEKLFPFFPFETPLKSGKHRIAITVYGHRRNALGPFYLQEKWPERTGPLQFKLYESPVRQLVPCGLLEAPFICTY